MSTTVTPPFTGSIATTLQGINVRSYRDFGSSLLPMIGRSDRDITFLSSSSGVQRIDASHYLFDDSIRFPVERRGVIDEDAVRITKAPNYELEDSTLGITRNFKTTAPYHELTVLKPVEYLTEDPFAGYPVVLDNPNAIDPFDMNGVIEPLTIRDVATRSSLFLGTNEDPEPHSVKGSVSGPYVEGRYGRHYKISSYYETQGSPLVEAFMDSYGTDDELLKYSSPIYTNDFRDKNKPFLDTSDSEESNKGIAVDQEMISVLRQNNISGSDSPFPSFTSKSRPCGFIYENSLYGIDSIVFGGFQR